jgi:hypothetical protein
MKASSWAQVLLVLLIWGGLVKTGSGGAAVWSWLSILALITLVVVIVIGYMSTD